MTLNTPPSSTRHIIPGLGYIRLRELERTRRLEAFLCRTPAETAARCDQGSHPLGWVRGPLSVPFHLTVGASLRGSTVRQRLITRNPAREGRQPAQEDNRHSASMLGHCRTDEYLPGLRAGRPAVHVVVTGHSFTGMRRGEGVAALPWAQVDLDAGQVTISRTRVSIGGRTVESTPKTAKGLRPIAIAPVVIEALRAWRQRQRKEHMSWGPGWTDTGFVFTWGGRSSLQTSVRFAVLPEGCRARRAAGRRLSRDPPWDGHHEAWPPEWRS